MDFSIDFSFQSTMAMGLIQRLTEYQAFSWGGGVEGQLSWCMHKVYITAIYEQNI
jgi:hypothetical protein